MYNFVAISIESITIFFMIKPIIWIYLKFASLLFNNVLDRRWNMETILQIRRNSRRENLEGNFWGLKKMASKKEIVKMSIRNVLYLWLICLRGNIQFFNLLISILLLGILYCNELFFIVVSNT